MIGSVKSYMTWYGLDMKLGLLSVFGIGLILINTVYASGIILLSFGCGYLMASLKLFKFVKLLKKNGYITDQTILTKINN